LTRYYQTPGRNLAGQSVGILLLDTFAPHMPGNVANQATYPFPVRFKVIPGSSSDKLLYQGGADMLESLIESARELQRDGVRAISAGCGYFARFQPQVADAVDVPVFLTSLLQVPMIARSLRRGQKLGILCADETILQREPQLLANVGIDATIPIAVAGLQDCPEFSNTFLRNSGNIEHDEVQRELLGVVRGLLEREPTIGALLFECSDLPPYAWAVQLETRLPIWDYSTMIRWIHSGVVQAPYSGYLGDFSTTPPASAGANGRAATTGRVLS
jgi:hypothetical protein